MMAYVMAIPSGLWAGDVTTQGIRLTRTSAGHLQWRPILTATSFHNRSLPPRTQVMRTSRGSRETLQEIFTCTANSTLLRLVQWCLQSSVLPLHQFGQSV